MTKFDLYFALIVIGLTAYSLWKLPFPHWITGGTVAIVLFLLLLDGWSKRRGWDRWLEREDDKEVVARMPIMDRTFAGSFAAGLAWTVWKAVVMTFAYTKDPSDRFFLLILIVGPIGLLLCLFLFGAGPHRLRLDVRRREYFYTQGFPLLTWTKCGPTDDGEIRVVGDTGHGTYTVWFRGGDGQRLVQVEWYRSREQAQELAGRIASRFNLSVKET